MADPNENKEGTVYDDEKADTVIYYDDEGNQYVETREDYDGERTKADWRHSWD